MKLSEVLNRDTIFIADSFSDTDDFYNSFSIFLKEKKIVTDSKKVRRLFIKRENIQSTAIGKGVATPHIFSEEFSDFIISIALIRKGMPYKSPDNNNVFLVFLIMSNDRYVSFHLKSLANIARLVSNTNMVDEIIKCKNEEELYEKFLSIEKYLEEN
ncbi:MAG: PTS sugar transporter subunit IIA [Acidobacteriota bacterium]